MALKFTDVYCQKRQHCYDRDECRKADRAHKANVGRGKMT